MPYPRCNEGRIIPRAAVVKRITGREHQLCHRTGRHILSIGAARILHNIIALPSEIKGLPHPRMDRPIGKSKAHITLLHCETAFEDLLISDRDLLFLHGHFFSRAQNDSLRIIKFHHVRFPVRIDAQNRKRTVSQTALRTYGERRRYRLYRFIDVRAFGKHRRSDLAGERRKDIRFHAASKPVGQNDRRNIALADDLHLISAQLFSVFKQAFAVRLNKYAHLHSPECIS